MLNIFHLLSNNTTTLWGLSSWKSNWLIGGPILTRLLTVFLWTSLTTEIVLWYRLSTGFNLSIKCIWNNETIFDMISCIYSLEDWFIVTRFYDHLYYMSHSTMQLHLLLSTWNAYIKYCYAIELSILCLHVYVPISLKIVSTSGKLHALFLHVKLQISRYVYTHTHIYIYMCVCVCICVLFRSSWLWSHFVLTHWYFTPEMTNATPPVP